MIGIQRSAYLLERKLESGLGALSFFAVSAVDWRLQSASSLVNVRKVRLYLDPLLSAMTDGDIVGTDDSIG